MYASLPPSLRHQHTFAPRCASRLLKLKSACDPCVSTSSILEMSFISLLLLFKTNFQNNKGLISRIFKANMWLEISGNFLQVQEAVLTEF